MLRDIMKNDAPVATHRDAAIRPIVRSPTNVFSWVTLLPLTACYVTIAYNGMPKKLSPLVRAFPYGTLSARLSFLLPAYIGLVAQHDTVAPTEHR
jgi:hypothetical protein